MALNKELGLSPQQMTTIAHASGLNPGEVMKNNSQHNSFWCLFHQHYCCLHLRRPRVGEPDQVAVDQTCLCFAQ